MQFIRQIALAALFPVVAWGVESSPDEASEQENPDFARYRTIIDRMPFGEPPPGFDPTQAPGSASAAAAAAAAAQGGMTEEQRTEEEQRLASSVRVSVLNVTPAGRTMVGFTDSSAKPAEHYYLPVGGERNGWTVKSADPASEKVTLAKGEVEVTLKLGEGSTGDGKGDKRKTGARGMPQPPIRRGGMMGARLTGGGPFTPPAGRPPAPVASDGAPSAEQGGGALARLRERRARLMQEKQAEAARRDAAAAEAKAETERREAELAEERERAAAEREKEAADRRKLQADLLQIQEEMRRQREEREKRQAQEQQEEQPE